jgi:hypothetical protein
MPIPWPVKLLIGCLLHDLTTVLRLWACSFFDHATRFVEPCPMQTVTVIHYWTLHLSCTDREWEARCGEPEPKMLVDRITKEMLSDYRVCQNCLNVDKHG